MKRPIVLLVAVLVVSGCSSAPGQGETASPDEATLQVVASTNVYGDIASIVGGDKVSVTSVITSVDQDPHSYEASARDQLAISEADLVIGNGGGYDPYIETLVEGSGTHAAVLIAVEASEAVADAEGDSETDDDGHGHIEGFNEHVWYDFSAMKRVAEEIAHELAEIDAANAALFEANAEELVTQIEALEERAEALHEKLEGRAAMMTEPVPAYLLAASGLDDLTPEAFTEAIEEDADVPPLALQETLELLAAGKVAVLAYNEQTATPTTERVRQAAEDADVPVVSFTETLPDGRDYISWMTANLDELAEALG